MVYAPGARYILVGTKEGYLKIIDTVSSKAVWSELAHEDATIWSIAVRPDGQVYCVALYTLYVPIHLYTYTPMHLYTYAPMHLCTYAPKHL